jgi:type IV pilus assembly protein PilP
MSTRRVLLLAWLAAQACGSPAKPARPAGPAAPAKPAAAATAGAAAPGAPAAAEWSYSSVGKRDPFRSYLAEMASDRNALVTRCATPLGQYGLEQLKLVAVVTGLEDPVAMVQSPKGAGYTVRRGACIGKNGGVVTAVRSGEVVVSEWVVRADGSRDSTQTVLRLPQKPALNLEE